MKKQIEVILEEILKEIDKIESITPTWPEAVYEDGWEDGRIECEDIVKKYLERVKNS